MSHEIDSAAYVKTGAWHGLGSVSEKPLSPEELYRAAKIDWQIIEEAIYRQVQPISNLPVPAGYVNGVTKPEFELVPGFRQLRRSDNGKLLAVMPDSYTVFQNHCLVEFFTPLYEAGIVEMDGAMSLREGKRVVMTSKIRGAEREVVPGDPVRSNLAIATGHDGSLAVNILDTQTRIVCANTLRAAQSNNHWSIKILHRPGVHEVVRKAQAAIMLAQSKFDEQISVFRAMAHRPMKQIEFKEMTTISLVADKKERELVLAGKKDAPRAWEVVQEAYETAPGSNLSGSRGTFWGGFNAITYYLDHERGRSDENRINASWFGEARAMRQRAFDYAVGKLNS